MSGGWGEHGQAAVYAETFGRLCAGSHPALLEALAPSLTAGRRALEVGCGTGSLAVRLADSGAEVLATDPDPGMLALVPHRPGLCTVPAALPELPLADAGPADGFDAVAANFVVNHLPEPLAGVRELARVTADGGLVALTVWPSGSTRQAQLWARVIEESGAVPQPGVRLPAEHDFPRTSDGLADLVDRAGLRVIDARTIGWTYTDRADALWRGATAGIGGIGQTLQAQTDEVRAAMRERYEALIDELCTDGRLRLETEAVLVLARRDRLGSTPSTSKV